MSLCLSLPRWHLRSCGGAADLRFVGGVDHASDGGNPFATSVVRRNRMVNKALDKIPTDPKPDALTAISQRMRACSLLTLREKILVDPVVLVMARKFLVGCLMNRRCCNLLAIEHATRLEDDW